MRTKERGAHLAQGRNERAALAQAAVKDFCKSAGCRRVNGILHGDHGRYAGANERRGHAAEHALPRCNGRLARAQHHQPDADTLE